MKADLTAILGVIALTTVGASASLVTTGSSNVERTVTFRDATNTSIPDYLDFVTADPYTTGTYDVSTTLSNADHPLIDTWAHSSTGSVIRTASLFQINASASTIGSTTRPVSRSDRSEVRVVTGVVADIEVTEATQATISFDGFDSGLTNPRGKNEVLFTVSSQLGSFADFSAGFNTGAQVTNPFSFDVNLLAGDVISVQFYLEHRVRQDTDVQSFDQSLWTSFSIQTVPAPGAMISFGVMGLAGSRRRRA